MKKCLIILTLLLAATQSAKATGFLLTKTTKPISSSCLPLVNLCCLKEGKATYTNILYLVELGDAGIDTAAKNGCIRQIFYTNQTETSFFIFFKKITTIVYGK